MPDNIVGHYFAKDNNIVRHLKAEEILFVSRIYIIVLGTYSYQFTHNYASYYFLESLHIEG